MTVSEQISRKGTYNLPSNSSETTQASISDSSQPSQTREERLAVNNIFLLPSEETTASSKPGENRDVLPVSQMGGVARSQVSQPSIDFLEGMRRYYLKPILEELRKIQPHVGSPGAAVYINQILHKINDLDERSPDDLILEVLFALYDALAFDGLWATYTSEQYEEARQLLTRIAQEPINPKNIEKAIVALDSIGFDITPYPLSLDDDIDNQEV